MPDIFLPEQAEQGRRDGLGRFVKGASGNPAGRPARARNAAARAAEALFDDEAPALAAKAIELALSGDAMALKLCLRHIVAPRRERSAPIALPPLRDAGDIAAVMAAVTAAVASGELTPAEAGELARVVEAFIRAVETSEFERRLQELEAARAAGG